MSFDRRAIPSDARFERWSARDGWPLRVYRQPARGAVRGSILWLGGRGDIVEKYLETLDGWAGQGWSVTSFDWRGQGGSGRLAANPLVGHVDDFAIWIDDLAAFVAAWTTETPGPHIIMGHSMGGHLVLRALAEGRIAPDKAVLVAPMLGFATPGLPLPLARGVAYSLGRVLRDRRPAWRRNERPARPNASRQAFLTHDTQRYDDEMWWKTHDFSLALGPPSWGWLAAAYRSFARLDRPGVMEAVETPLLILGAEHDQLVSFAAIERAARRLPHARLMCFGPESAHEILREVDSVRQRALGAIEDFINA